MGNAWLSVWGGAHAWAPRVLTCALASGCGVFVGDPIRLFPGHDAAGLAGSADDCIETVEAVTGDTATILGGPASAFSALVSGTQTSTLAWVSGSETRVAVKLASARVLSVRSQANPAAGAPYSQRRCEDHVRIVGSLSLVSLDGRLDQTLEDFRLTAYGSDEARGSITLAADALTGSYHPLQGARRCHVRSTIRVLIASDGTHGSITDELTSQPCGDDGAPIPRLNDAADAGRLPSEAADDGASRDGVAPFAGGHWGARWQNY